MATPGGFLTEALFVDSERGFALTEDGIYVILAAGATRSHTTDASLAGVGTRSHTTSAFLLGTFTRTHTSDAVLVVGVNQETRTHTTDGLLLATILQAHTTDAYIAAVETRTHTTDALLLARAARPHTADAYLVKGRNASVAIVVNVYLSPFLSLGVPSASAARGLGVVRTGNHAIKIRQPDRKIIRK